MKVRVDKPQEFQAFEIGHRNGESVARAFGFIYKGKANVTLLSAQRAFISKPGFFEAFGTSRIPACAANPAGFTHKFILSLIAEFHKLNIRRVCFDPTDARRTRVYSRALSRLGYTVETSSCGELSFNI